MDARAILVAALAVFALGAGGARVAAAACPPAKSTSLLLLSARTGATVRHFPDVDQVAAVASDGHGGWFVSAGFTCSRNVRQPRLVRLDHAGHVDGRWRAALPGGHPAVSRLLRVASTLYATGAFGVVALDVARGSRRWLAPVAGGSDPGVLALAANDRAVYVGGGFRTVDGEPHPALVALDARTGRPLAWAAPVLQAGTGAPMVNALALAGTRLYLGGSTVITVDGQRRPGFAAVDAVTGRLLPWTPGTAPGMNAGAGVGDVEAILVARGLVLSAGHDGFGIVSARTGAISGWMRKLRGVASVFAAYGSIVYLGGNIRNGFGSVGSRVRNDVASIDLARGRVLPFAPKLTPYVAVSAMAADRDEVLVGGDFFTSFG